MDFTLVSPKPNIFVNKPIKFSSRGNVYRIPLVHTDAKGNTVNNYEVWATKEVVQNHFNNPYETPREYQLRKFARQMYEKRLRSSGGRFSEKGMFVTTNQTTHGNPIMWPHIISDPEIKV